MAVAIPLYRPGADVTVTTTAAVVGKTFADITGPVVASDGTLVRAATATAAGKALGVFVNDAASGQRVGVIVGRGHVVPVTSAAAVAAGDEVEVGASGKAAKLAAGKAVGRAWSTVSTADAEVFVELY